jgi:hypothetical protein
MHKRLFIWLVVGGGAFSSTVIIPGISLADAFFLCSFTICLLYVFVQGSIRIHSWFIYIVLLLLSAIIGGWVNGYSESTFSELEFMKSLTKLSFYGIGSLFLAVYVEKINITCIGRVILNILTFNAVIAIYIFVAMLTPENLPYEFFWFWQQGPVTAGYFGSNESGFVRARGIFSEPSNLAIFQTMGLAFLYFKTRILNKFSWQYLIVLSSILLTFSMTGYFLLSILMVIFYRQKLIRYMLLMSIVLTMIILFTPLGDAFNDVILERFFSIIQGYDGSANARLFASWELPFKIVSISPAFGAGLGNLESIFEILSHDLAYAELMEGRQGWNVLAYVLGTMGTIGFVIFVMFIVRLIVLNPLAGIIFVLFMFASGRFLEPLLWIYYVLYSKSVVPILGNLK